METNKLIYWLKSVFYFLADFFKIIGLYLPSLIFSILMLVLFTTMAMAYDMVTIYAEFEWENIFLYPAMVIWAVVTWYGARLVYYSYLGKMKKKKKCNAYTPENCDEPVFHRKTSNTIFRKMPRLLGFLTFISFSITLICHCYFPTPKGKENQYVIYVIVAAYLVMVIVGKLLLECMMTKYEKKFAKLSRFNILLLAGVTLLSMFTSVVIHKYCGIDRGLVTTFISTGLIHICFALLVYSRRAKINQVVLQQQQGPQQQQNPTVNPNWIERGMVYFSIPPYEKRAFTLFLGASLLLLGIHIAGCADLLIGRIEGPLPFIILAFAFLTSLINLFTILNLKLKVNLNLFLVLWIIIMGWIHKDHYRVRIVSTDTEKAFEQRPQLQSMFNNWMERNSELTNPLNHDTIPMYFVIADGGASRSAYWTAAILGELEDNTNHLFSQRLFALSGASGGSVGNAAFYSLLYQHYVKGIDSSFQKEANGYFRSDFLSSPLAHYLGQDLLSHLLPIQLNNRADGLEIALKNPEKENGKLIGEIFGMQISKLFNDPVARKKLPVFFINTTRMQDSWPGVISSMQLDSVLFNHRLDILDSLDAWFYKTHNHNTIRNCDMELVTAAIMGARFPYVSPAGSIGKHYFVDGGYFDNSGAGIVHETIMAL